MIFQRTRDPQGDQTGCGLCKKSLRFFEYLNLRPVPLPRPTLPKLTPSYPNSPQKTRPTDPTGKKFYFPTRILCIPQPARRVAPPPAGRKLPRRPTEHRSLVRSGVSSPFPPCTRFPMLWGQEGGIPQKKAVSTRCGATHRSGSSNSVLRGPPDML